MSKIILSEGLKKEKPMNKIRNILIGLGTIGVALLFMQAWSITDLSNTITEQEAKIIELDAAVNKAEIDLQTLRDALATTTNEKEILEEKYNDALLTIQQNNEVIFVLTNKINTMNEMSAEIGGDWTIGEKVPIPTLSTVRKQCTDYRHYNIAGSPHNRLQQAAWTDSIGCRRFNNDYIVALGTFYTEKIGDRFEITLANGNVFTVIFGDSKADKDTDATHMYAPCPLYGTDELGANLLEFIIDEDVMTRECYEYGGVDYYEEFRSDIVKMVYLGRDNSADWDTWR
jgi:hypothetical protein